MNESKKTDAVTPTVKNRVSGIKKYFTAWLAGRIGPVDSASAVLDLLLYGLSYYVVPAGIVLLSILVIATLPDQYADRHDTPLDFRVLGPGAPAQQPADMLGQLARQTPVPYRDTHLSEAPFWFSFDAPVLANRQSTTIELPSRHMQRATCWNAATLEPLGAADRRQASGVMHPVKAGFSIELGVLDNPVPVVCEAFFSGPARISVVAWPDTELQTSARQFDRSTGLLEGGLFTLSVFVLVTALINREWLYVLFAAWLVGNLRLGALSMGWDTQWLEHTLPYEWVPLVRKVTIALYYLLTYSLFTQLFKGEMARVGYARLLRAAQAGGFVLLALACVLPYARFLPAMWVITAFGIAVVVFLLTRILLVTHSRVAIWYSASLGITLFSGFSEVIAAALDVKALIGALNSVTAALASSLMAALAIAEQVRAERKERVQMQAELLGTYEVTPIGLFTLDADGSFLRANPALEAILNTTLIPNRRKRWDDYFGANAWNQLVNLAQQRSGAELEIRRKSGTTGELRHFLVKAALANSRIEGSLQDITEQTRAIERLRFLAENDPLTGVLNRRGIEKVLDDALLARAAGHPLALAYLDLDRFKLINDLFGHRAGDAVLRQVCDRAKQILNNHHYIGRVGGDEFVIVFCDTDLQTTKQVTQAIVAALRATPYQIGSRAFQVRGSIGLIEVTEQMRAQDALSAADRACREAKKGRGDHMVVYERNAPAFQEHLDELRLIEKLGSGFSPQGLFLEMQPIMSLQTPYDSMNFEVLLRMRDTNGTVIPAGKIVAAAEENGDIAVIDRWVLTTTLNWLDSHHTQLSKTKFVCVNLSGASLNDEKFVHDISDILSRFQHVAHLLCIEITESVALHDLDNTRRFMEQLQSLGARVALDDFGAGYTSFSYLKDLSADALKIDGAFIRSMNAHPANIAIVEAIVELTHNLGMKSIAEWVEDYATLEALWKMGVDYVQGFVIARPQLPERILEASSAASFIADEKVAAFVRDILTEPESDDPLDTYPYAPSSTGWH